MGILDDLESERDKSNPDPWSGSEDKLEEWLGLVPEGTMPSSKKAPRSRPKPVPNPCPEPVEPESSDMKVKLSLCLHVTDVYKPTDFNNSVAYARALKFHSRRIPKGFAAGDILEVEIGKIYHTRRVAEPVLNRAAAFQSPEFTLALVQSIKAISEYKRN